MATWTHRKDDAIRGKQIASLRFDVDAAPGGTTRIEVLPAEATVCDR